MDIARKPVEFGHRDLAIQRLRSIESGLELRPAFKCVGAFAGFNLDEFLCDLELLGFSEARDRRALRFNPVADFFALGFAWLALTFLRDAEIGDDPRHFTVHFAYPSRTNRPYSFAMMALQA